MSRNIFYNIVLFGLVLLVMNSCKAKQQRSGNLNDKAYKENLVKANKGLVALDQEKIENFVKRHQWDMEVTQTGMWYQVIPSAFGDSALPGKIAHLKYQVSLLDGTICYSSDSTGNLVFKVGQGGVESGLEEAILMMKTGDKGRFIMPPHLAHGLLGDENKIPPRTIIVYQAELLNLTDY